MARAWKAACWLVVALAAPQAEAVSYVVLNESGGNSLVRLAEDGKPGFVIASGVSGFGLTADAFGNYVVATGGSLVWVTQSGKTIKTVTQAPPGSVWRSVALDAAGNYIVLDSLKHAVWRISPDGASVVKVATYLEDTAADASGIAINNAGNYFVFEQRASSVINMYLITPAGAITRLALQGADVPPFLYALAPDGSDGVLAAGSSPGVFRISPTGDVTAVTRLPYGYWARALAKNPETGEIIAALFAPHTPSMPNSLARISADGSSTIEFATGDSTLTAPTGLLVEGAGTTATLAHFAVLDQWKSSFTVVNASSKAAQVQLRFIGENGLPVSFPYSLPQISQDTLTDPVLSRTIPAGGTLAIDSREVSGQTSKGGWARLTSDQPSVGAVVVFKWIPYGQEAAVASDTRNASAFVVPFDNTQGSRTGAGVTNLTSESARIPVVARDENGNFLQSFALVLPPLAHTQFLFAEDRLTLTAGLRGSVEFQAPANGRIAVTGLRFTATGVLTTLPVIAK